MRHVFLISLLLLGACSTQPTPEATTVNPEEFRVDLPQPEPVTMREVEWRVINQGQDVYFALTPDDYEDLALNMNELLRWIREVRAYWKIKDE